MPIPDVFNGLPIFHITLFMFTYNLLKHNYTDSYFVLIYSDRYMTMLIFYRSYVNFIDICSKLIIKKN